MIFVACCQISLDQEARGSRQIDYDALTLRLRAQIVNRTNALNDVAEAIAHLGYAVEGPTFWTTIANDPSYSPAHRRKCVFALFRRYGVVPNDVAWLANTLDKPTWLSDSDVEPVTVLTGWIPVDPSLSCTTFRIKVLSDQCCVYFVIVGEGIRPDVLYRALRWNQAWEAGMQDRIITQIGVFDELSVSPKPLPAASRMDGQSVR